MEIRLQKALAQAGIASRRKAEELISGGRVEVNGAVVREMGRRVDPSRDLIRVDGRLVEAERKVYFLLYKPAGMVTTLSDPQGRPTLRDCLQGITERVFAVGRLDFDAEGALLITNDGALANRLMHPRYGVPKTYLAKVKGEPDDATLEKLRSGVLLEDGFARPEAVERERAADRNTWLRLVVAEGRPHLVKRLCAAVGHPILRLYRPRFAGLSVEGMRPGSFRPLTEAEVARLSRAGEGAAEVERAIPIRPPPRRHRAEASEPAGPERAPKGKPLRGRGAPGAQQPRPRFESKRRGFGETGPKGAGTRGRSPFRERRSLGPPAETSGPPGARGSQARSGRGKPGDAAARSGWGRGRAGRAAPGARRPPERPGETGALPGERGPRKTSAGGWRGPRRKRRV